MIRAGQARGVRLGPLPEDALATYIGERFSRSGREVGAALDPLLATARGHPQRAMLLAHFLWERTPPRGRGRRGRLAGGAGRRLPGAARRAGPGPVNGPRRPRLVGEGHVWGDDDALELVDPLLSLWIANGRRDPFT